MSIKLEKNIIYHVNFYFHVGDKVIKQVNNATKTYIIWDGKYLYKNMRSDLAPTTDTAYIVIQDNRQLEKYPKETDEEGKEYIILDDTLKMHSGISLTLSNATYYDKFSTYRGYSSN